jgi:3-phosphoshikimate 1-carboxyvinyltransferase
VSLLNERPYIEMTLSCLRAHHIPYRAATDFSRFVIPGGAAWRPFSGPVPGDFSSAAFPACAAAVSGGAVRLLGLDPGDTQGDKFFFDMLARMGCEVRWEKQAVEDSEGGTETEWVLEVSPAGPLRGGEFDLNDTPDLLPAAAVLGAYAAGDTALVNAAHARIKETDRIAVMAAELAKLGVPCAELPGGLVIRGGTGLSGGRAEGRGDHRIVMALAAGACGASGPVEISDAESAAVTYPGFLELLGAEKAGS